MKFRTKLFVTLIFVMVIFSKLSAKNPIGKANIGSEILFFDDFEEAIGAEGVFTRWTSENMEGWHYWHIIPWNGNPGQCIRFETTGLNQNDWLITKPVQCAGTAQLKINFNTWFENVGEKPARYLIKIYMRENILSKMGIILKGEEFISAN